MIQLNLHSPSFNANPDSTKLKFRQADFFVRIHGYGKNSEWAKQIISTADESVKFIRRDWTFENILKKIAIGVTNANKLLQNNNKANHSGILRIEREGWKHGSDWDGAQLVTPYEKGRYSFYKDKFEYTRSHQLKNPFNDIALSMPVLDKDNEKYIKHASPEYIDNAFNHLHKLYLTFVNNYIKKEVQPKDMKKLNGLIATMRWILAHATPWERGSDAISNVLMRAMYKSAGVKTYPLEKGISLDLEAYCTNLKDYKKRFTSYFAQPPEIIEDRFIKKIENIFQGIMQHKI